MTKWASILSIVFAFCLLGVAPFYVYHRLDMEIPIAKFHFAPVNQYLYDMTFYSGDMCDPQTYRVRGDQAQIDASFLKWQSWVAMLGVDSLFRFDRLSGRFRDINAEKENARTLVYLSPNVVIDPFRESSLDAQSNWLVSTQYGSSVYVDIDTSLVYTVYKTEDSMMVKSQKRVAFEDDSLLIEINSTCLASTSLLQQSATNINDIFVSLLSK